MRPARRILPAALVVFVAAIVAFLALSRELSGAGTNVSLDVSYTGINYYDPVEVWPGCDQWSWLRADCYHVVDPQEFHISPARQFRSDMAFIHGHRIGGFLRIWISLDELMRASSTGHFAGYDPQGLANVDDMLHVASSYGIRVDLVLLSWSDGATDIHQFQPQALDGQHPLMRRGYLRAVRDFVAHIVADPVDASTVVVMDLENEAYYQLEKYFNGPANLGSFTFCKTAGGDTNWACVDTHVIHPWLQDLYAVAKSAAPHMLFTISDTGYLLQDYAHWNSMYPVDVYDVHSYAASPSRYATLYREARRFDKPWFSGETGCQFSYPSRTCWTYRGNDPATAAADLWWLRNLRGDGAKAVLIEGQSTVWNDLNGPYSQSLTRTGRMLALASTPSE